MKGLRDGRLRHRSELGGEGREKHQYIEGDLGKHNIIPRRTLGSQTAEECQIRGVMRKFQVPKSQEQSDTRYKSVHCTDTN